MVSLHGPAPDKSTLAPAAHVRSGRETLPADRSLDIHRIMVRTRAMEERMIEILTKNGKPK